MKFLKIIFILSLALGFSNCKEQGCTDPKAWNHCYDCKKDNGTCVYYGTSIFWFDEQTNDSLYKYGHYNIELWIDGVHVNSRSISGVSVEYSVDNCESSGFFRYSKELNHERKASASYELKNFQSKNVIWKGNVDFTAENCSVIKLVWKP